MEIEKLENVKIVLIGDNKVGKTSILNVYLKNKLNVNYEYPLSKIFEFKGRKFKFDFIETDGKTDFKNKEVNFLKISNAVIFVFDLTNKESFDKLLDWFKENKNLSFLIGNKSDLLEKIIVPENEIYQFSTRFGCQYFECSAKNNKTIKKTFKDIISITLNNYLQVKDYEPNSLDEDLENNNKSEDKRKIKNYKANYCKYV